MKILMLGRIGLLDVGGGDKVQIERTAAGLRDLGVEVDIKTGFGIDFSDYDLVHVFQLDWTPETYFYALDVKKAGKPLVLSPIHHSVAEVKRFDDEYAFDFRRLSAVLFKEQHARDTFKNVYRSLFRWKKAPSTFKSIFIGLKNMHRKTLEMADVVLVQTEKEAEDLKHTYGRDFNWVKVVNGVGEQFINPPENPENPLGIKDYILCVGRIEPRKDQLSLIKAVEALRERLGQDIPLVLIGGKPRGRHFEYIYKFDKALKGFSWISYIPKVLYEQMPSFYSNAKVGASVSWFESTGLTSLEALFCGANVVVTGSRVQEYLGDLGHYAKPGDVGSIVQALEDAYKSPSPQVSEQMKLTYTWDNAASQTLEVYKNILQ
jgi:glycosyltransferase involved in cell wall biosynthesis